MLCRACLREIPAGSGRCPRCGAPQEGGGVRAAEAAPAASAAPAWDNPWEQRGGRGWFAALGETLQRSLLHPGAFFRGTDPSGGVGPALLYAVLIGTIAMAVMGLWQRALSPGMIPLLGGRAHGLWMARTGGVVRLVVWAPLWAAFNVLFWSVVFHAGLRLAGTGRAGIGATVKAVGYSCSALALTAVPVLGWAVWLVWMAALQVIGFRELHRTSGARAFLGWALPLAVAFLLAVALVGALTAVFLRMWQELGGQFEV